jgi:hypothetical protein
MDWQAQYATGEIPWDEGAAHPALIDFITEAGRFQGRILVPGCGRGNDVRGVSTPGNRVLGLDIAPAALQAARAFPPAGAEEYRVADLFNLPPELRGCFDWVVEHTCFCAIDPALRPAYAAAVAGALKPGAHLLAIFYLDPAVERHPPYGTSVPELDALFSPFFTVTREWVPARTFEGRESRELVRLLTRL